MRYLYLDSSVVLRYLYRRPGFLDLRGREEYAVAGHLTEIECLRTLDRNRLADPAGTAIEKRQHTLAALLQFVERIELTPAVLNRASRPMAVPLGTLDAIHLATALGWQESHETEMSFATHDRALARAARMYGFAVIGADPD
ncbi:MAG: PIN domain-containing protein [Terriglobales bacterium]